MNDSFNESNQECVTSALFFNKYISKYRLISNFYILRFNEYERERTISALQVGKF